MNDVAAGSVCARFYQPLEHHRMRMPTRNSEDVCLKDGQRCQARLSADNREEKGIIRGDGKILSHETGEDTETACPCRADEHINEL